MLGKFVRRSDIVVADMDGEAVMMNVQDGRYYGMTGIGARIWNLLAEPVDLEEVVCKLCSEYDIDEDSCARDAELFIRDLLKNGLITSA